MQRGTFGIREIPPGWLSPSSSETVKAGPFYKSLPLPGSPTEITVSPDGKLLAVIYSVDSEAYVAVYSIDSFGDLTAVATSRSVAAASFSGVAFSQ